MTTLFDLLKKTYISLGQMEISTATGGSVSTIIDTKLGDKYGDGDIVGSTIFIIRDAGGNNAAPQGEVSRISDYVQSTNTITISPSLTAAVASGDTYGIAKPIVEIDTMIELANMALQGLGTIQLVDTSLTTIDDTTEYSLPVGFKYKIDLIQMATNNDAGDYQFNDLSGWYQVNSGPGSTGMLIFNNELPSGNVLKLFYEAEHPRVQNMSDSIAETLHSEYATRLVVDKALEYQVRRTNGTDPFLLQTSNKAMQDVMEARTRFANNKHKRPKYLTPYKFQETDYEEDEG